MDKIKCDKCGKTYTFGNRPNGLPNGIGFQQSDGSVYNMCCDCIMEVGRKVKKGGK